MAAGPTVSSMSCTARFIESKATIRWRSRTRTNCEYLHHIVLNTRWIIQYYYNNNNIIIGQTRTRVECEGTVINLDFEHRQWRWLWTLWYGRWGLFEIFLTWVFITIAYNIAISTKTKHFTYPFVTSCAIKTTRNDIVICLLRCLRRRPPASHHPSPPPPPQCCRVYRSVVECNLVFRMYICFFFIYIYLSNYS